MDSTFDMGVIGNVTIVINPNVRVLIDNSDKFDTYKNKNIKVVISRKHRYECFYRLFKVF